MMVSEKKKLAVEELKDELEKYPVIGMLDMFKLPARQLQEIRDDLRGKAVIKMVRKNVMKLAIEDVKIGGLDKLESEINPERKDGFLSCGYGFIVTKYIGYASGLYYLANEFQNLF